MSYLEYSRITTLLSAISNYFPGSKTLTDLPIAVPVSIEEPISSMRPMSLLTKHELDSRRPSSTNFGLSVKDGVQSLDIAADRVVNTSQERRINSQSPIDSIRHRQVSRSTLNVPIGIIIIFGNLDIQVSSPNTHIPANDQLSVHDYQAGARSNANSTTGQRLVSQGNPNILRGRPLPNVSRSLSNLSGN